MFSLIQNALRKVLSLDELSNKVEQLEQRVMEMENISAERDSLWLFIEEMQQQEQEAYQILQDELSDALVRSMKPQGEA